MQSATIKRIGILRGGAGERYASSLQKGGEIILHISENLGDKYKVVDILIDKEGDWYLNGMPINPADLIHKIDVIWNTAHPSLSVILNNLSIPNIGHGFFSFALENNKDFLKEHIKSIGVQMPRSVISPKNAREVFEKFGSPWIVKIFNEIKVVKTFDELTKAINGKNNVIVEEFIPGKIASVHSVAGFRGDQPASLREALLAGDIYTFPLGNSFGSFSLLEKEKLVKLAKNLHQHIGAKHYLKSDFVLTPRGKVYLLQISETPDLKPDSHFSQVCELVGAKTNNVVEHIIESVL